MDEPLEAGIRIDRMERSQATTSTIYVRLLEEAVTCIRPTQAEHLPDGSYLVLPTPDYDPADEVWEFVPGSKVHCQLFDDPHGAYLLAIAEASVERNKKGRTRLSVLQSAIEYRDANGRLLWHIKSENIVLVAEYTTNEGPFGDDWFLVFGIEHGPLFFTCTVYSDGAEALFDLLRTQFAITPKLTNSTEWKSVVLWPKSIEGAALIEFSQREPQNWRERLRTWYDGPIRKSALSVAVRDYLESLTKREKPG
jgi:hypothetical protein